MLNSPYSFQLSDSSTVDLLSPAPLEDKILQRGGEELFIEKQPDRFTVAFASNRVEGSSGTLPIEGANFIENIPGVGVEFQVESGQLDTVMATLRTADEILSVSHVYQLRHTPETPIYLTNQLTLLFAESVTAEEMNAITAQVGLRVFKLVPGVPKAFVFQVSTEAAVNPIKLANRLMRHPSVLLAEPNLVVKLRSTALSQPSPENTLDQKNSGLSLKAAWQHTQGIPSVVVAVAEETIDLAQPVFQTGGKVVAPLVDWQERGERREERGREVGEVGMLDRVAPGCGVIPIAIGSFLDDAIVEWVYEWAIEKSASVLVCGWRAGLDYYPLSLRQQVALTRAATKGRRGKGCLVVYGVENDAVKRGGRLAAEAESNAGENALPHTDRPSLDGFALHPDVMTIAAVGSSQLVSDHDFDHDSDYDSGHDKATGISLCAPIWEDSSSTTAGTIVAGVAALVLSANPALTAWQVKQLLQTTADKMTHSDLPPNSQPKLPAYDAIGYSQAFGYGMVNALRAVLAAQQQVKPRQVVSRWIEQQVTIPVDIPDGDPQGIFTSIHIDAVERVCQIEVSVEIEHSFMGDLEIYLLPPNGTSILLQPRTAGRVNILRKTYTSNTTPLLESALNQPARGKWQLQLVDRVLMHTGRLKRWGLKVGV
ncbi:hypothetical protein C7B76_21165 [filamentous cyanobacterium CCP2]|nr:hypothetical protein C7B76_21165 [filamentous cyanobacterium CCP2]